MNKLLIFVAFSLLVLSGCSLGTEGSVNQNTQEEGQTEVSSDDATIDEDSIVDKDEVLAGLEENASEEFTTISFEGIRFEIPSYVQEGDPGEQNYPMRLFFLDSVTGTNFNVLAEDLTGYDLKLDEYVKLGTDSTGFEYLNIEIYEVNGLQWNEAESINHTENGDVYLNQRTVIIDNVAYIFSYGSAPGTYDEYVDVFREITDSVTAAEE